LAILEKAWRISSQVIMDETQYILGMDSSKYKMTDIYNDMVHIFTTNQTCESGAATASVILL